jgi:YVTN family beta-propeller protein
VSPFAIAITPDGKTAYVVNRGDINGTGTVTPITTATNRAGNPIRIDEGPGAIAIAITRDGKTAYVTNSGAGTVMPIATATNTLGKPIKVGRRPFALVIAPDSRGAGHH